MSTQPIVRAAALDHGETRVLESEGRGYDPPSFLTGYEGISLGRHLGSRGQELLLIALLRVPCFTTANCFLHHGLAWDQDEDVRTSLRLIGPLLPLRCRFRLR